MTPGFCACVHCDQFRTQGPTIAVTACDVPIPHGYGCHCPSCAANTYAAFPTSTTIVTAPSLSDADVERIARRVVDLLREAP